MKMGFAKTDITPSLPCYLGGYELRKEAATAVHRPLYCRTMAGDDDGIRFAIVCLDLLGIDKRLRDDVCAAVEKTAGIHADRITLIASHTHSAIEGIPDILHQGLWMAGSGAHVPHTYRRQIVDTIAADARSAIERAREASIRWFRADCPGIAGNRRKQGDWADSRLHWMKAFAADSNELMGGLLHFACHPTVIGPEAGVISSDFPGVLQAELEADYNGVFLFANGAAGDISTRFTRQGAGPLEADRIGRVLLSALEGAESIGGEPSAYPSYSSSLIPFAFTDRKTGGLIRTDLQMATLGGMILWLVPGEPFASVARNLMERRPDHLVVGFANDYIGYIPDVQSWPKGGYEVEVSRIGIEDSDKMWRCFQ
ncbi:neutral/alkaline non-lysosomal ceramidase N-terminal domain-containing protein [Cohnella silvisoli]|uniref:Neutral/alkaline non-lysosomal ceramidase N-terminal domain-containing protein n=1 Tax=Cohnella silvisoli TaxID=2873699 RepID=A0ABV1KT42_9BACL|nr:neutral/alkaline non-lysosomal ceramidase N-terminal domain-containing protein [Cohnella silvisoli]MCD9022421.1 neutral/alkaline non-lysosomal ceramidase N-terminal domain-containing protein [Cohnella silvisoli]